MFGILTGMSITLKHFFGHKVTRLYPYEKRVMPPRMRGLIHYLMDENGRFKCEACLLCEKICPPQAITVSYRQAETPRDRPLTLHQAIWGNFQRPRRAMLSHVGRPELAVDELQPKSGEPAINWARVSTVLWQNGEPRAGLTSALGEIQQTVGYLPRHALTRLSSESGVDLSDIYSLATGVAGYHTRPVAEASVLVCQCPVCRNAGAAELDKAVAAEVVAKGGRFSPAPSHTRCLGDARQAPVLRVNGRAYGNVTVEAARQIAREFVTVGGSPR